ncbi:helix-turn-helix transcriptional regulator [Schinkia azotoformans]|uniref:HTH cro/C1-type domain-containing protein n=1 Tax=Schinkia azotoformans LMG 9581 TaxID=1131731 RepID=K6E4A8_SCHAZ|nr:helix-turn-helix transcriptional regulator [Schinkia azotoformans]EKN68051.1 hypothetical protein BAZO_06024 [Schinkia azotoformans LMG 9581]MEC1638143.1 helix-turn-helix transcriptional regulator [Schinkia azotoformans]MEC1946423.1 helix-turn-helix transcriptional regulator [Schinkia azotoformans]
MQKYTMQIFNKIMNHEDWKEIGQALKQEREEWGIGITKLAEMHGTSASRIRNFENGLPVQMSKHLEQCYKLGLENYKNSISKQVQQDRKILQIYEGDFDQFKEKFYEFRYEAEKWEHILHGFIGGNKLENAFYDWIDKQQQYVDSGQDDEFGITNELYGDLDELREHFSYLLEEPTLISKTMFEAKSKKNADLLNQLLEQFRLYMIAKSDEQRQQAEDIFRGNFTELYQRFNKQKISQ